VNERLTLRLWEPTQAFAAITSAWKEWLKPKFLYAAADGAQVRYVLEIRPETRSSEQNARMWAMLTDVSQQVEWYGKRLTPEDWKHVFTASLRKLDVVPNIEGTGFVALGLSTSKMTKRELGDLMELIEAFGAERGVTFKEQT
jgi:hypothetical protein